MTCFMDDTLAYSDLDLFVDNETVSVLDVDTCPLCGFEIDCVLCSH